MNKSKIVLHSLGHTVLAILYVTLIASGLRNSQSLFGKDTVFAPIAFLMLFVLSAAIMGTLVLGRPVLLYVEGKKTEALKMFGYTVLWFAAATVIFLLLNTKLFNK